MRVIQSKLTKTNPKNFSNWGHVPGSQVLDPPFTMLPTIDILLRCQ